MWYSMCATVRTYMWYSMRATVYVIQYTWYSKVRDTVYVIQYTWYSICDTVYVIQYSTVYVKEVLTAMPYTDRNIANKCKLNLATPAKKSLSPRQNVLFMQYMSTHIYFTQKYILYISFCLNMNNMLRRGRRKSAIKKMIWKKRSGEIQLRLGGRVFQAIRHCRAICTAFLREEI